METVERPLYILPQIKKRGIIPKIFILIFLGSIFYLGILLNLALLNIPKELELLITNVANWFILVTIIMGLLLGIRKSTKKYKFYKNRIMFGRKQIFYKEIVNLEMKNNLFDKIFKTYSIKLNKKFTIRNIPLTINISSYIKQLISYAG